MELIRFNVLRILCIMIVLVSLVTEGAKGKSDEQITLEPISHEFYWKQFNLSPDTPVSPDGRYRFKKVCENGWVELVFWPNPSESEPVIAKPMPRKFEKGNSLPMILVVESNPKTQTAVLKELLIK